MDKVLRVSCEIRLQRYEKIIKTKTKTKKKSLPPLTTTSGGPALSANPPEGYTFYYNIYTSFTSHLLLLKLPAVEVGVALWIAETEEEVMHALDAFYLAAEFFVVVNSTGLPL